LVHPLLLNGWFSIGSFPVVKQQGMNQLKTNRLTTRDEPIENPPFNNKG
jgi:hypothetical protein